MTHIESRERQRKLFKVGVDPDTFSRLVDHAGRRGMMARDLASELLRVITTDDLVSAVLDDDQKFRHRR